MKRSPRKGLHKRGTRTFAVLLTAALGTQGLPVVTNSLAPAAFAAEFPSGSEWDESNIVDADSFGKHSLTKKADLDGLPSSIWGWVQFADRGTMESDDQWSEWRDTDLPEGTPVYMRYKMPNGKMSRIHRAKTHYVNVNNADTLVYSFTFKDGQPDIKLGTTKAGSTDIQLMIGENNVARNKDIGENFSVVRVTPGGNYHGGRVDDSININTAIHPTNNGSKHTWGETMVKVYQVSPAATTLRGRVVEEPKGQVVRTYSGRVWVDTMNGTYTENSWGGYNPSADNGVKFDAGDTAAAGNTVYQAVPNEAAYQALNQIRRDTQSGSNFRKVRPQILARQREMADYVRKNPENFTVYKATTDSAGYYTLTTAFDNEKYADYIYMWVEGEDGIKTNMSAWTTPEFRNPLGADKFKYSQAHGWNTQERGERNGHVPYQTHIDSEDPQGPQMDTSGNWSNVDFALAANADGTSHTVGPIQAKIYDPDYKDTKIGPGKPKTIPAPEDSEGKQLPPDTKFEKESSDFPGKVEVDPDTGAIKVTPNPGPPKGSSTIEVTVKYPDGSSETIDVQIEIVSDSDGDGVSDADENATPGLDPNNPDSDGDGIGDGQEDEDGDGIDNATESVGDSTKITDTDGDGTPDIQDKDSDGDGVSDADENATPGLDPTKPDTDGDGTGDGQEDWDGDGKDNDTESNTDPNHNGITDENNNGKPDLQDKDEPKKKDTDGDGIPDDVDTDDDGDGVSDADENATPGLDPTNPDSDGDGTGDGQEDEDGDGIDNGTESDETSPKITDTDGDGTPDLKDKDSDGDGVSDADENATPGLDPTDPDSDGDGTGDGQEDWDGDGKDNDTESNTDPNHDGITDENNNGKPDLQDNDNPNQTQADENTPGYNPTKGKPGETKVAKQVGDKDLPSGTKITVGEAPAGWTVDLDPNTGDLTITSPSDAAPRTEVSIPVTFIYPDKTKDVANAKYTVVPKDAIANDPNYVEVDAPRGKSTQTGRPKNSDGTVPPAGTTYQPGANASNFPGKVEVDPNTGEVTITPNADAPLGDYNVPIDITYPDLSSETINVKVHVVESTNAGFGSSGNNQDGKDGSALSDRCVGALAGISAPLLLLIPLGLAAQVRLPGLERFQAEISRSIADINTNIQRQIGIFDENISRSVYNILGPNKFPAHDLLAGTVGIALATVGLLLADEIAKQCVADYDGLSSVVGENGSKASSIANEGSSKKGNQ